MATNMPYVIGGEVSCADGVCGRLSWVVIDPMGPELTHLVVEPDGDPDHARLVPVTLVDRDGADAGGIRLRCGAAGFAQLEPAVQTEFLPGNEGRFGYPADQNYLLPYFALGPAGGAVPAAPIGPFAAAGLDGPQTVTYDRVPSGEVQVKRNQPVHATDGEIGRVQGLVVDPRDRQVTHVLLQEGHLWGKKQVALPIHHVTDVRQGVRLDLTKDEVRDLPPVDLAQFE